MSRVLLVDGSDETRAAVRDAICRLTPSEVVERRDASSAATALDGEDFDVVLLEVELPDGSGFDLCRRIRSTERTARLPVVFLTATHYQVESRLRALELGAADFIVQPVSDLELGARITSVLRSKAAADEVQRTNFELVGKVNEGTRQLEELAYELRVERDALRETFDVIEHGLFLFDASGKVQIENAAGRRLREVPSDGTWPGVGVSGVTAGIVEAPLAEGPTGPSIQVFLEGLAREAISSNATCDRSLTRESRQLNARGYPVAGRRALVYVRDVTEERDKELRRLQAEKLASIGMMAAGVAHEINNPASFVLANIEALLGLLRLLDDKLKHDPVVARKLGLKEMLFEAMSIVQESKEGMARIYRIVRDLHSFSRVDDDATAVTDVNAALESSLTMLRSELRYRAAVERDLKATRPVRASAARLGQVFLNLVINAAHAMPEGNLKRNRLRIRSFDDPDTDTVVIEVEDNGPGIPPEVMPRIFESFFTTKPPGLGTGLGLPISRDILRSVGGELTADSEVGRGALFRVRLPAIEGAVGDRPRSYSSLPGLRRRRILAVDDEALLLKAYRRMLIEHHDVEIALGAKEALRLLEEERTFDVVLCDLQMPDITGGEFHHMVKTRWPALAERFIFITGGAFSTEARRFLDESDLPRIHKPFQLADILELIHSSAGGTQP